MTGVRLVLKVRPGAGKDSIDGLETATGGGMSLLVRVRAQPEKGRANEAVIKLLAQALGLPKSRLAITAGETGRRKTIFIPGDADRIRAALHSFTQGDS